MYINEHESEVTMPLSNYPGEHSKWEGFDCYEFKCAKKQALIVKPKTELPRSPWIWRARFFGAFPALDIAMLNAGFHIAFVDTANMFGAPAAMQIWDEFYDILTGKLNFSKQVILEGFSRGGLFVYNWAARFPEKVVCLYADAPVCDIRSWPAGFLSGPGSSDDWKCCKQVYGITEEEAKSFDRSPIDILKPIADAKIPIIHVCGGADEIVPITENSDMLQKRLQELGHDMTLIVKPDCLHHPHSLENPTPIYEFILKSWKDSMDNK